MTTETLPWFVLYVKPRHEKNIASILQGKGFEQFLPLFERRSMSRISKLPLFPGYVFCRFDPGNRLPILTVPGVFSIVTNGGKAVPVADAEVDALQRVVRNGLPREPWPTLTEGTSVVVARGPLQGVEGLVVSTKNCTRVIISVGLLQRAVAVEVEREWLDTSGGTMAHREGCARG